MSYGVINGLTGSYKITPARTKLPIYNILPASDLIAGVTPDTFVVQLTGLYQIDLNINLSSPGNNVLFTLELFNVTTNTLVQRRAGTAPGQAFPADMYFGFDWNSLSATDEYAFYITPDLGAFYKDYALLVSDLNFRAVIQMFGGSGVMGAGTAGAIPVWVAHDTQGDSIMTQAATTVTVAGAVSLAGTNVTTFLEFTDGQNAAVSAANQGRIRYNANTQTFEFSENGGAWADLSGVGPGTVDRVAKFNSINTVADSNIIDTGAQIQMPVVPVTADADADVIIQSSAAGQVPLVVQGAAGQTDSLQEWHDSAGGLIGRVYLNGGYPALDWYKSDLSTTFIHIQQPRGIVLSNDMALGFSLNASASGVPDISLSRKASNVLGISDGDTSDAIRIGSSGRIYGNAVANPTPDPALAAHLSNGTLISVSFTAAHNLCVGQTVTLAGWTWNDGGGVVNGTWLVNSVLSAVAITLAPTTCPTNATNPSVVGTVAVVGQLVLGALPVTANATADVIIQSTSVGQVPLVIQGSIAGSQKLTEWFYSTGYPVGNIYATLGGSRASFTEFITHGANYAMIGPSGLGLEDARTITWGADCTGISANLSLSRKAANVLGIGDGGTSDAIRISSAGRVYGNAVLVFPSVTDSDHTTDGTSITIRSALHSLCVGQTVTLAGWTWAAGGGVVNGTWIVTFTNANYFSVIPTICPTAGSNPTVVGTVTVVAQLQLGAAPTSSCPTTDVLIQSTALDQTALSVRGAAGQTSDIQAWNDAANNGLAAVDKNGSFRTVSGSFFTGSAFSLGPDGLSLNSGRVVRWSPTANWWDAQDLSLSRKAVNVIGIGDGVTSDAIRISSSGRIYGNAVASPVPSATLGDHTTNGTIITVKTTAAHNLCAGQTVTLAGWTWAAGGGVVNGTWIIGTVPTTTTFTVAPTTCPTAGSNPTGVGTTVPSAQLVLGALPVAADVDADVIIQSTAAGQVPLVVQGYTGQTDNLQEWRDSTGFVQGYVNPNGYALYMGSQILCGSAVILSGNGTYYANSAGTSWSSTPAAGGGSMDLSLSRKAANVLGIGNGGTSDAIRVNACGRIYGNAVTTTPDAAVGNHTVDGGGEVTIVCTATGDNVVIGQTVVLAGWTWAAGGGDVNGTWVVTNVYTGGGIAVNPTLPPTAGSNPTVVGTITVLPQIVLGNPVITAGTGVVLIPGTGPNSTCVGFGSAANTASCSFGGGSAGADYGVAVGPYATVSGHSSIAIGVNSTARITKTINISGLDCVRLDDGQTDYWHYYGSRVNIVYGPEVNLLGAPVGVSVTIPAGSSVWLEEVGWIVSGFNLDGGALTVQPTVEFGITGTLAKYLAAQLTTLLTGLGKRERYVTLLQDDGETTALTANMTVAGTIAGGGASVKYKARPYWVLRAAENSSSPM